MADLTDIQSAAPVKLVGASSTGAETSFVDVGQQVMSACLPVVIASDQSSLSVTLASPGTTPFFSFGDVATAATTQVPVRRTTYTEQTTDAQRSIVSSSANDTSAGTGAQQVILTYYTSTGVGPNTETITLNGVTPVNTINTDICYIEKILVSRVGSTGSNVGTLTLRAATGGGGAIIGTISATNNQTFWAHHYVALGKTCDVSGISVSHNGTTVGSGAVFVLKSKPLDIAGATEVQISDFVRLYGQSSTFARNYNSQISVVGPARIIMYVTPESSSSFTYRAAFDQTE